MGRKILADAGYEVITVNNGSAALKKIAEQKPDLIVLDVYMPGYSGLEVCQRLKEVPENRDDPALYNAVNRDLRTVVGQEQAHKEGAGSGKEDAGKAAESTVDVTAVAPAELPKDSLPKDVTPEEIAAIAAAAAQVQGATATSKETSETAVEAQIPASESASV